MLQISKQLLLQAYLKRNKLLYERRKIPQEHLNSNIENKLKINAMVKKIKMPTNKKYKAKHYIDN